MLARWQEHTTLKWIVMPAVSRDGLTVPRTKLAVCGGFVGMFLGTSSCSLSRSELVPIQDPRLNESVKCQQG
jgi:hypothetical protein